MPENSTLPGNAAVSGSQALRVLVIESDSAFITVLDRRFSRDGWKAKFASAAVPVEELTALRLAVLVVDAGLIGDGFWTYLRQVRSALPTLPIIATSSRSDVATRVRGLREGLLDWVAKPGHPEELLAKIEVASRITLQVPEQQIDSSPAELFGGLAVDASKCQVFVNGLTAGLTKREYELFKLLSKADGKVLSREEIYERVWGYTMAHGDRSVDVFVRKLRKKLEALAPEWKYIHTHFGFGYRFAAEPNVSPDAVEPSRELAPNQELAANSILTS